MRTGFPIIVMVLLLCAACHSQKEEKPKERSEPAITSSLPTIDPKMLSIDELVETELRDTGTPGAALIIVHDGKIRHARGYGYSDVESRVPATLNTIWPIASITKVLTSIAVMQLVEAKKITLDADVNTYLKTVKIPNTFSAPITVADRSRPG